MDEEAIRKSIEKRIKRLIKAGESKKAFEFSQFHEREDLKDAFYNKLHIWTYTKDRKKRDKLMEQAKNIADKVPELKGWPKDSKIFWNTESYGWERRIPKEIRKFIKEELSGLKGKNLSLGSGCYPYVDRSVLIDFSEEMLNQAPKNCTKIKHDLEKKKLPFKDSSFDSVTAVFIVDYIKNLRNLFKEVKRVLKKDGRLVIVNSKKTIDDFYRIQEKKHHDHLSLKKLLAGFDVKVEEKQTGNKAFLFIEAKVYK